MTAMTHWSNTSEWVRAQWRRLNTGWGDTIQDSARVRADQLNNVKIERSRWRRERWEAGTWGNLLAIKLEALDQDQEVRRCVACCRYMTHTQHLCCRRTIVNTVGDVTGSPSSPRQLWWLHSRCARRFKTSPNLALLCHQHYERDHLGTESSISNWSRGGCRLWPTCILLGKPWRSLGKVSPATTDTMEYLRK